MAPATVFPSSSSSSVASRKCEESVGSSVRIATATSSRIDVDDATPPFDVDFGEKGKHRGTVIEEDGDGVTIEWRPVHLKRGESIPSDCDAFRQYVDRCETENLSFPTV